MAIAFVIAHHDLYSTDPTLIEALTGTHDDVLHGGIVFVGSRPEAPNWDALVIQSWSTRLNNIITQSEGLNLMIALAIATKDVDGNYDWDEVMDEAERTKINTWLTGHGFDPLPEGITDRQAVVQIFHFVNDNHDKIGDFFLRDNEI